MSSAKIQSLNGKRRPRLATTINTVKHLQRVPTPHLTINYQLNPKSTFWRS
jgi:hypothetical protein